MILARTAVALTMVWAILTIIGCGDDNAQSEGPQVSRSGKVVFISANRDIYPSTIDRACPEGIATLMPFNGSYYGATTTVMVVCK